MLSMLCRNKRKPFTWLQFRNGSLYLFGLFVSLCVISIPARCDIYAFTDANGTPNFSNVPTDDRYVLTLRTEVPNEVPNEQAESFVQKRNEINRAKQTTLTNEIKRAALVYHLDPALLHAVIATESGYEANAVSRKGAMGLMQLMPETARRYGVTDPFNPSQNIQAGTQHLNSLLKRFGNDLNLALAAYNSGESNVVKYGSRIPPFSETRAYVPKVMGLYRKYQRQIW